MKAKTRTGTALAAAAAALILSGCGNPEMSGSGAPAAPITPLQSQPAPAPAPSEPSGISAASPGSSAEAPPAAAPPAGAPAEILIKGFKFPDQLSVRPGTEITVRNEDLEAHSVTADSGTAFDMIIQNGTGTFTAPAEPGTYAYHCIFHGNMRGTLTVK